MQSWKTLNEKDLAVWKKKIETARTEDSVTQSKVVDEYYSYLIDNRHHYGQGARLAASNQDFIGQYANNYAAKVARNHGTEMTPELPQNIKLDLALQDIEFRKKAHGDVISMKTIGKYHIRVFKNNDLPPEAWIGTNLESIKSGILMLNQSPLDQHEHSFNVNTFNQFAKKASQPGSPEHLQAAQLLGTSLNDGALCNTIAQVPITKTAGFVKIVYNQLDGNPIYLVNRNMAKLIAEAKIRSDYNQYYQAIDREERAPSVLEVPSVTELFVDPMAGDKWLARYVMAQPNSRAAKASTNAKVLKIFLSDIDPIKEARIEYQRTYHRPMPDSFAAIHRTGLYICTQTRDYTQRSSHYFKILYSLT